MDFPTYIDTISMGLPILYFKGSQIEFSQLLCISVPKGYFNLSIIVDPDEMQHNAAFHLDLHCLGSQYTKGYKDCSITIRLLNTLRMAQRITHK